MTNKLPEKKDCHDCGAKPGEEHQDGCDVERCTVCKGQRLGCSCEDHDKKKAAWTGYWPGELECIERGWLVLQPCELMPAGFPDLNRWAVFQHTGKDPGPMHGRIIMAKEAV